MKLNKIKKFSRGRKSRVQSQTYIEPLGAVLLASHGELDVRRVGSGVDALLLEAEQALAGLYFRQSASWSVGLRAVQYSYCTTPTLFRCDICEIR